MRRRNKFQHKIDTVSPGEVSGLSGFFYGLPSAESKSCSGPDETVDALFSRERNFFTVTDAETVRPRQAKGSRYRITRLIFSKNFPTIDTSQNRMKTDSGRVSIPNRRTGNLNNHKRDLE